MIKARVLLAVAWIMLAAFAADARDEDEDLGFVNGKTWLESSTGEKLSYLVGIGNLMNVEYAYQQKSGDPPSNEQSIMPRLYKALADVSLDELENRIDRWYESHPKEKNKPVVSVIWIELVEPEAND